MNPDQSPVPETLEERPAAGDPWPQTLQAISRPLMAILGGLVVVYVVLCALPISQIDLWWQLTEGLRLLHSFHLPTAPAAAFGFPASPYFDEYAGYEIALALLYKLSGFWGLWVLFVLVYLLLVFLPSRAFGGKFPTFDFFSTASILVATVLFKFRFEQRPEFIGELFLVLLLLLLCRSRIETLAFRHYLGLFFIFLVWTNTHSSFIIGLFALGLWLVEELILKVDRASWVNLARNAALILVVAIFASALNPYGAARLLFPFQQASDPGGTILSGEMWPLNDFHSVLGMLVLAASALLVFAFLTCRTTPAWLVLFSMVSLYLAFKNVRFANLVAISLLFVNAGREARALPRSSKAPPALLALSKIIFLIVFCAIALAWDNLTLTSISGDLRRHIFSPTDKTFFDPPTAAVLQSANPRFIPLLCGHGEDAYLSFPPGSPVHPMLDSGLAHFSDPMKRYFLFVTSDPAAFELALAHLQVPNIIVNRGTLPWILSLSHSPGWKFISCDEKGQLWERDQARLSPGLDSLATQQVQTVVDKFIRTNQQTSAFCYSVLLENTPLSLRLLARYQGAEWSDALFSFVVNWVSSLDEREIAQFLQGDHRNDYPLADAIVWARLGAGPYDAYIRTADQSMANSWQWHLIAARVHLVEGNRSKAETDFDSIPTPPVESVAYYSMWEELKGADSASRNGRWQMWDASAESFFLNTTNELNQRLEILSNAVPR